MRYLGVENTYTQPIYDTIQLAAAAAPVGNLFAIPRAGALTAAANKTYAHTNLIQAGRLEKGVELIMEGISLNVRDTASGGARVTLADYLIVMDTAHIDLLIGNVSFLHLPAILCPAAAAEVQYFSNIAAAATEFKVNHGLSSVQNFFKFDSPLLLEDQESIQVVLTVGGTIAAVTDVMCVIRGQMKRPVR